MGKESKVITSMEPTELVADEGKQLEKVVLLDMRELAAAVAVFPHGKFGKTPNTLEINRTPASKIGPAYVSFYLEKDNEVIAIVVACPDSGPEVNRIVLRKDGNWIWPLQAKIGKYVAYNHGVTQSHIDALTAYVRELVESPTEKLTDEARTISDTTRRRIGLTEPKE